MERATILSPEPEMAQAPASDEPALLFGPDGPCYRWQVETPSGSVDVDIYFSGTVAACDPDSLPSQIGDAVRTRGRSVIERSQLLGELPLLVVVSTADIAAASRLTLDRATPGEKVFVCHGTDPWYWTKAVVERAGDPDDALIVEDDRVVSGPHGVARRGVDVVWASPLGSDNSPPEAHPYGEVRRRWSVL